ncbi:hypothetical protein FGG08_001448 [Glutinoglossum americanum]|uniref:WHIM1 domain-containing protein n=1 Tax=Glutinoglossum americanum TaxID=1670608 RepID=A0A9P8L2R8_9PEZI|nr:hypothetical protein FGG08_001448 [Glutinoglossum americanum]
MSPTLERLPTPPAQSSLGSHSCTAVDCTPRRSIVTSTSLKFTTGASHEEIAMSSSESSPLSSPPSTDDEIVLPLSKNDRTKQSVCTPATTTGNSPAQKKRPRIVEPPHEYVLADNPDIAFIVMFRSRFSDVFPKSLPNYGPQDIERGVVDSVPAEEVESLLCALVGLVLNRKKYVERGHYQRALEEALQTHTNQWPSAWNGANPLSGGKTFASMSPTERLTLLKTLILWSLSSSEAVQALLKESYKQARHDDDLNQPLSVQSWGRDGDKRRYWLIEGRDDTYFRLYRESNPALKHNTWWSVAGSIEELKAVAQQLAGDGSQAARRLSEKITLAIPRFEATEEKRKRREYRNARKAMFTKIDPGLYEGRTRGKRIKYTYSTDDEDGSEGPTTRRSTRHSGLSTPAEPGPTFTASGRQVRSRVGGVYGETILSGHNTGRTTPAFGTADGSASGDEQVETIAAGRPRRSGLRKEVNGWTKGGDHIAGYNSVDEMDDEEEATSSGSDEYGADDDEIDIASEGDNEISDEDTDMEGADGIGARKSKSLVVSLRYGRLSGNEPRLSNGTISDAKSQLLPSAEKRVSVTEGRNSPPEEEMSDSITVTPATQQVTGKEPTPVFLISNADIKKREQPAALLPASPEDTSAVV